jgi:transcriptional regulator with XRE-family HTH domain
MLTAEQLRAARALLGIKQSDLAEKSEVSLRTIARLELGEGPLGGYAATIDALQKTLEAAGVIFQDPDATAGPGVRLALNAGKARKRSAKAKRRP